MNLPQDHSAYGDLLIPVSQAIRSFVAARHARQPMFHDEDAGARATGLLDLGVDRE